MTLDHRVRRLYVSLPAEWRVRSALVVGLGGSNAIGILVVAVLVLVVVPLPPVTSQAEFLVQNGIVSGVVVLVAGMIGVAHAWRTLHPVVTMARPGARFGETDRSAVLTAPRRIFVTQALLWVLASFVFLAVNLRFGGLIGVSVFLIVGLAGWSTSCLAYLFAERSLRPVARLALAQGLPQRRFVRSVAARSMFAWALGTGVSVIGIMVLGIAVLASPAEVTPREVAATALVLGGITLVVGGVAAYTAAAASSEPITQLRAALAGVERGDLDTTLPIYDGTEIGMLQAGFNQMVTGLRERERLQDLFGRHVGTDVARQALEAGVRLGGEVRSVTVLFVDVEGSTTLAEECPADEVVALLNRFFEVVIDVVHAHGGLINKFAGDAALAIWGAPTDDPDQVVRALRAARAMADRLATEVPGISAGIGVSGGQAVAGNVGASERYEYTVIGDPVNEAARLTDAAKSVPARVLANHGLVAQAPLDEQACWREVEAMTVRGRRTPTPLATPTQAENAVTA